MNATLPASVTDVRINLVGLAAMLLTTAGVVLWRTDADTAVPLLMAVVAAPILLGDTFLLRVHLRPSTGLDFASTRPIDPRRVATRWLGGLAALGAVLVVYGLAPEYQGAFYDPWYRFLGWFGPLLIVAGGIYFAWIDRYLVEPRDAYWHVGAALTRQGPVDWPKVADLARTWAIKGFFTALMYKYAWDNVHSLQHIYHSDRALLNWLWDGSYSLVFLVDVTFTTLGYLLTMRVFDTHVRSAEPTTTGWLAALVCYQPFFSLVNGQYVKYEDGYEWGTVLEPWPVVKWAWGAAILVLVAGFSYSTVAFGCRFSNLTNRGVVTGGLYRWTRHPAYVTKCLSFWLMFAPFAYRGSWYEVARDCVWLSVLCWIYWMRARTEEQHLSRDPDYVRYALYMNEHSVFAFVGRWFPFLQYHPPEVYKDAESV